MKHSIYQGKCRLYSASQIIAAGTPGQSKVLAVIDPPSGSRADSAAGRCVILFGFEDMRRLHTFKVRSTTYFDYPPPFPLKACRTCYSPRHSSPVHRPSLTTQMTSSPQVMGQYGFGALYIYGEGADCQRGWERPSGSCNTY